MLTLATVYAFKIMETHNGFWLVTAMLCDVAIFASLADIAKAIFH